MSKQHPKELQKLMVELFKSGNTATKIAKQLSLHTTSVTRVLKRNGLIMSDGKGKNHPNWKGGRGIKTGYMTVFMPEHPRANNIRRVFEHILVAEKKLGRPILKSEPIHHVDLDRLNNNPSNLEVLTSHSEHQQLHASLDKVVSQLIKNKVIKFKNREYTL